MAEHEHHKQEKTNKNNLTSGLFQKIYDNRKIIIILIVIFLLAFTIRGHLLRYNYIFEFDSYYHARTAAYLLETGSIPARDPLAYYEIGGSTFTRFLFFWAFSGSIYEVFNFWHPFSKEIWFMFVKVLPALFGALIALSTYWLGKELFNSKKAGIITAFAAAVTPAFVYRTMAGFFEEDSLGFLWLVIGFIFFVRAIKAEGFGKKSALNSVLAGIFFGIMAATWEMYLLIPFILLIYFCVAVIMIASEGENSKERLLDFLKKFVCSFGIFVAIATLVGATWLDGMASAISSILEFGVPYYAIALIIIIALAAFTGIAFLISKASADTKKIVIAVTIALMYCALIATVLIFIAIPDFADRTRISNMVGEESTGNQFFGSKYNSLIIIPIITLIALPIILYLYKEKDNHVMAIAFIWVLITLFMAWYKLKFTYAFGFSFAVAGGFLAFLIFETPKRFKFEKGIEAKILALSLLFIMVTGVGASAIFVPDNVPYNDQHPEWARAMEWIKNYTPEGSKLFNWWDQGHILAWVTERKVSTDNRNQSYLANRAMAIFVTSSDTNLAYRIASESGGDYNLNADYVILGGGMFSQGASFTFYIIDKVDSGNPDVKKFLEAPINILNCSETGTQMNCSGNLISKEQFEKIPTTWTPIPSQFYNNTLPLYFYREGNSIFVLNNAMNSSNLAKVWFHSPETEDKYEEVFSDSGVKIFKILK